MIKCMFVCACVELLLVVLRWKGRLEQLRGRCSAMDPLPGVGADPLPWV